MIFLLIFNRKKDTTSFEVVALPYLDFIYKSACRLCGNPTDAEDLAQETFEIAFEKFSQLKDDRKCKSWLFIILRNLYLKEIERHKKYQFIDFDKLYYSIEDVKHTKYDQIRGVMDGELQDALNKLDERYKTPLILSYIGDFSYQEIADILKIPLGTVMSRIARGKMFLKKELTKMAQVKS
jgi:RNA polymerase sigma-70 factor (ECF subfamily)